MPRCARAGAGAPSGAKSSSRTINPLMGQATQRATYHCPCGEGTVTITTTGFGGAGKRKLHTALVRCPACTGRHRYVLDDTGNACAIDLVTNERLPLREADP